MSVCVCTVQRIDCDTADYIPDLNSPLQYDATLERKLFEKTMGLEIKLTEGAVIWHPTHTNMHFDTWLLFIIQDYLHICECHY